MPTTTISINLLLSLSRKRNARSNQLVEALRLLSSQSTYRRLYATHEIKACAYGGVTKSRKNAKNVRVRITRSKTAEKTDRLMQKVWWIKFL